MAEGTGRPVAARGARRAHPRRSSDTASVSFARQSEDFLCPVCFEIIDEAMVTRCGHTFCNRCIVCSIRTNCRCPKCGKSLDGDGVFPNFLLNELVAKRAARRQLPDACNLSALGGGPRLRTFLSREAAALPLDDVQVMLQVLETRRAALQADSRRTHQLLLREFLVTLRRQRADSLTRLQRELTLVQRDLGSVDADLQRTAAPLDPPGAGAAALSIAPAAAPVPCLPSLDAAEEPSVSTPPGDGRDDGRVPEQLPGCSSPIALPIDCSGDEEASLARRRRRVHAHFDDLVQCYFSLRPRQVHLSESVADADEPIAGASDDGLGAFTEAMSKLTRYSRMRPLASLNYGMSYESNIVSSIEFDKDREMFAIAGVTKKIKLYDYNYVVRNAVDLHYPMLEMVGTSKISCLSWNGYHKAVLASSDYEGSITIWDTSIGEKMQTFQEHEKRCWSVDFNVVDTNLIASASDDFTVKLWAANASHSVLSLDAKVNVCCVKFSPTSRYHLAFGSADHSVHYYDLRNVKQPLRVFRGHQKAVSYVKFVGESDLVSASTDSQLKLWNVNSPGCLRSFQGHVNEKNFVGLTTDGNYVACGSEDNALYVYYKGLSRNILTYKFEPPRSLLERERSEDSGQFVSAVCWKADSTVVLAANSQGIIKVLEMC